MVRKYYDLEPEVAGGGTEVAEAIEETPEMPAHNMNDVLAAMAKHGVKNDTAEPIAPLIPLPDAEVKTDEGEGQKPPEGGKPNPEAENGKPKETATELPESQANDGKTASELAPQQEIKPVVLSEVLKNHKPETVLKELGFNDEVVSFVSGLNEGVDKKLVSLLNNYKTNGVEGVKNYLSVLTTDYVSMQPEDIMRKQIAKEYPKASPEQLEVLYDDEIVERYKLDPDRFSETEVARGKMLLEAKAERHREDFINEQQQNLLKDYTPPPPPPPPDNSAEEKRQSEALAEIKRVISESDYTKKVIANNAFTVGDGENKFTYPVDTKEVLDLIFDADKSAQTLFDVQKTEGQPDKFVPKTEHQILVATVQKYGMDFIDKLYKHGISIGAKSIVAPIQNASPLNPAQAAPAQEGEPRTPAEAMARRGRTT